MAICKAKIVKLYQSVNTEVIDYMIIVHKYLTKTYGQVNPEWKSTLEELAKLKQRAIDVENKIDEMGITVKDKKGNTVKNPLYSVLTALYIRIEKCLSELGCTPKSSGDLAKSRNTPEAKEQKKEDAANDFITALLKPVETA